MLYVLFAILLFGILIFIHELGHYIFARVFGVTVYEFSIGMGPKLFSVKSKKTGIAYSLRILPIGGFVSMAGEDEESKDPNSINRKPVWQRIIITAAGSLSNILLGVLVMAVMVLSSTQLYSTTVAGFPEEGAVSCDYGLKEGDVIVAVGPRRVHIAYDLSYAISRYGGEEVDVKIRTERFLSRSVGKKHRKRDKAHVLRIRRCHKNDIRFALRSYNGQIRLW